MADIIAFETLVDNLNTELNALSTELFNDSKISREINFEIVPHYQDNEESSKYDDATIGAVAVRGDGSFAPSQTYSGNTERMIVTFDAFTWDADDMDYILNEYANRNTGKLIKSDDWVYSGTFEKPAFIDRTIDEGEKRIVIFFEILYSFVFKGITSDDILLKINDVEVPVISYVSKIEKNGPSNDTGSDAGKDKSIYVGNTLSKTIKFVHINETEINNILEDIDSGDYLNRTYDIFYGVSCDENGLNCVYDNGTVTMVLGQGTVEFTEGRFQTIEATFYYYRTL